MHQKVETAGPVTDVLGSLGNEVSYSATVSVALVMKVSGIS